MRFGTACICFKEFQSLKDSKNSIIMFRDGVKQFVVGCFASTP